MNVMPEDEKLLTLKEAQAYLRVSRSTVLRLMDRGEIAAHKIGSGLRFYEKDLKNAVKRQEATVNVDRARNRVEPIDIERN